MTQFVPPFTDSTGVSGGMMHSSDTEKRALRDFVLHAAHWGLRRGQAGAKPGLDVAGRGWRWGVRGARETQPMLAYSYRYVNIFT
jgi:hypothetical protein